MEVHVAKTLGLNLLYLKTGEGSKYVQTDQSRPLADLPPDVQALVDKYLRMPDNHKRTIQTISDALTEQEINKEAE